VSVAVRRALEDRRLHEENRQQHGTEPLIGDSPAVRAVFDQIPDIAASDAAVLLLGESGTGKELVARGIHWHSARRDGSFVAVNCAALPEGLLESELFGHERGAFTGATHKRSGLLVEAHGGTLFLDEIADMPVALQAKLLRVLQDKTVRAVGGREEVRVDFRIVSATNRDVAALLRAGKFREDLYYRLAVIPLRIPALRERPEDIPLLATHFLTRASAALGKRMEGFDAETMTWLMQHRWPGNVRELENVVQRAATLARGPVIGVRDLRTEFAGLMGPDASARPTLSELERSYIERVLSETRGDKRAAARILGVSVRTLQRRHRGEPAPDAPE
jgi:DNA-binding NtrC family response regulator